MLVLIVICGQKAQYIIDLSCLILPREEKKNISAIYRADVSPGRRESRYIVYSTFRATADCDLSYLTT